MKIKTEPYKTLFVIVLVLLILFLILNDLWLLYIAISLCVIGLLSYKILNLFHFGWMKLAEFLGIINTYVLLTIIFYLVLTPLAIVRRMFSNKSIRKKIQGTTNLTDRKVQHGPKDFINQW